MTGSPRPVVVLYSAGHECPLCDRAKAALTVAAREAGLAFTVVEVDDDPVLDPRYGKRVPVLSVDGADVLEGRFDGAAIRKALGRGGEAIRGKGSQPP